jgi:hypothetical protein
MDILCKDKVFIRYLAKFQQKSFFLKKQLKNGWKTNGRWLEDTPLRSGIFQPLKY